MSLEGINVCIRVRPFIQREIDACETNGTDWQVDSETNTVQSTIQGKKPMKFDRVFDNYATNSMIYDEAAKRIVESAFDGVNGTILAYGQTSSGKTFTMSSVMKDAFSSIFSKIRTDKTRQYDVSASYCEVYNENITDLADVSKTGLIVSQESGMVRDLTIRTVNSEQEVLRFHEDGTKNRKVGATKMNSESSRSHSIFQVFIKSSPIDAPKSSLPPGVGAKNKNLNSAGILEATINFVDLAGSERASQTEAKGDRLQEGAQINKSLLVLGKVIRTLASRRNEQPPYRESKLTQLLRRSLGGNCRTTMICCVTMAKSNVSETTSTLSFAVNAKNVVNTVGINETLDDKQMLQRAQERYATLRLTFLQFWDNLKAQNVQIPAETQAFLTQLSLQKGTLTRLPLQSRASTTTAGLEAQLGVLGAELAGIGEVGPVKKQKTNNHESGFDGFVQLQGPSPVNFVTPINTGMQTDFSVLGQIMKHAGKDNGGKKDKNKKRKSNEMSENDEKNDNYPNNVTVYNEPIVIQPNTTKVMELLGYADSDESLSEFFEQNFAALEDDLTNMLVSNGLFNDTRGLTTTIDEQKNEILILKKNYEELHQTFTQMMKDNELELQKSNKLSDEEILKLRNQIQDYQTQLQCFETNATSHQLELQSAAVQYQLDKNTREQEIKQLHEQIDQMNAQHLESIHQFTAQFQSKELSNMKQIEALSIELDKIEVEFQQYKEDTELLLQESEIDLKKAVEAVEGEKDDEVNDLKKTIEKLRQDHQNEYNQQASKFETVRNNLLDELQEVEEHNFREYSELEKKFVQNETNFNTQIANLNKQIENLNSQQIENSTKIHFLQAENESKLALITDLRQQKEKEMAFISDRVKSVTGDKDKVITTMENELTTLRQYQQQQQQLYEGLQTQYRQLEAESGSFKRETSDLRVKLSTKEHELQRIRQRAEEVSKKQKDDSETLVKRFKEKIIKINQDHELEIEKKDNEILRLKELQQTFAGKVKKSISDAKGERDTALGQVEAKEKERRRLEHDLDSIKIRYGELQKSMINLKQDLSKQREQTHSLESSISEEANLKKFHIQENLILKKNLQSIEVRYNEHLSTMQAKFERDISERTRIIQQLENQQQQKLNEIEYYKQSQQETVNKLGQAMAEVQTLKMQLQQSQQQVLISNSIPSYSNLSTLPSNVLGSSSSVRSGIKKTTTTTTIYQDNDNNDDDDDDDNNKNNNDDNNTTTINTRPFNHVSNLGLNSSPYKRLDISKPSAASTRSKPEVVKFVGGRTTRAATRRAMNHDE